MTASSDPTRLECEFLDLCKVVIERIRNGSVTTLKDARQALCTTPIESREVRQSSSLVTSVSLEDQVATVMQFLEYVGEKAPGFAKEDIPSIPEAGEGWMLAVYLPSDERRTSTRRTFEAWWAFFTGRLPDDFTIERPRFKKGAHYLRELPGVERSPGIYWVKCTLQTDMFTTIQLPQSIDQLWGSKDIQPRLAGPEVLMALAHFPTLLRSGRLYLGGYRARQTRIRNTKGRSKWHHSLALEVLTAPREEGALERKPVGVKIHPVPIGAPPGCIPFLVGGEE